jgi:hypothetical protein
MSDPCTCHACIVAGVDRPSVTIPAYKGQPAIELHGVELMRLYEAQDGLKAALVKIKGTAMERAISKALPEVKP